MIEINLKTEKPSVDITNIGGLDFSKLKPIYVLIAILLFWVPDFLLNDMWETEKNEAQQKIDTLTQEKSQIDAQITEMKDYENKIEALKKQETELLAKLEVVKEIISTKRNPWNVLLYVTKNIPPEVWLTKLDYTSEPAPGGTLTLTGFAVEYKDQGRFATSLENSVFFEKQIDYKKIPLEGVPEKFKAYTPFEMQTIIKRLE